MWTARTIEERAHPASLCHYDGRLYWLVDDEEADPVEDTLGRTVARRQLVSYDIKAAEIRTLAASLPPSQTLAVGPQGAFVWGLERESVLRISHDGEVSQLTRTEQQPDGGLRCVGERLFFVGKLNPATTGVAVYEPDEDRFRRVFETGDPTPSTLDRVHIEDERIYYLTHDPRGWVLESVDLTGEEDEELVTDEGLMCRVLAKASRGFLIGDDHALYRFADGELAEICGCEVPPDHLDQMGGRAIWTTSASENADGELVEPWRVYAADLEADASPEVIYETADHIADITCESWGVACLLREARIGVVAEIGTGSGGAVVVVAPR